MKINHRLPITAKKTQRHVSKSSSTPAQKLKARNYSKQYRAQMSTIDKQWYAERQRFLELSVSKSKKSTRKNEAKEQTSHKQAPPISPLVMEHLREGLLLHNHAKHLPETKASKKKRLQRSLDKARHSHKMHKLAVKAFKKGTAEHNFFTKEVKRAKQRLERNRSKLKVHKVLHY